MSARVLRFQLLLLIFLFLLPPASHAAQATLAWDAVIPAPDGYRLFQRLGNTSFTTPVWTGATTTCDIADLNDNTTYYFVVRAYVGNDESGNSNEVIFSTGAAENHTISATAGPSGSITPAGSTQVPDGGVQTYAISANSGYHVSDVQVDGISVGTPASYTFSNVNADHTIDVTFAVNTYTISASAGANGSISPSGSTLVPYGTSRTYSIAPSAGHHVADVRVDGVSMGRPTSYTFSNVSADHTIAATFAVNTYTISASAGTNGSISPSGTSVVLHGANRTYSIAADSGYRVSDVTVDGLSVGAVQSYTFASIAANHTITAVFTASNQPPHSDAGPDQTVDEATHVKLSGLNSADPDDGLADLQWRQISGPPVQLSTVNDAETTFTAPDVGTQGAALVFELTVSDYSGLVDSDTCIVNVSWVNRPPTAQAGGDQIVSEGSIVQLDGGHSVDPDDGVATYRWRQVQGPEVVLDDTSARMPVFAAPDVMPQGDTLVFELTVSDHGGLQDTDECLVTVVWVNAPPQADAGPDQTVAEGEEVILNGANSLDPDDGIAMYQWSQTDGTPVTLSDATAMKPSFSAPEVTAEGGMLAFRLAVTDHSGLTHHDTCIVNITAANTPPSAVAGMDQTVEEGCVVTLDGSASNDPDDGISDYQWAQIEGPQVTLSDPGSSQPQFMAPDVDAQGATIVFRLSVIDYSGLKGEDTCLVNVSWRNQPPVASAGPDRKVTSKASATLDGSGSFDQDDGISTYRWKQISGPPAVIGDAAATLATIQAPEVGSFSTLVFELTVTDQGGLQSTDRCAVTVEPLTQGDSVPPVLAITYPSSDFMFVIKSRITLKGTAADDGGIAKVVWHNQYGDNGQASGTTSWRIDNLRLRRWMNEITLTAYDTAGNKTSQKVRIYAGIWR